MTRWTTGRITGKDVPGPRLVRLRLAPGEHSRHLPGQLDVVRLRAPDGYTAQRAYSIASDPDDDELELLVERLEDGEVSTFLADDAEVGDELELPYAEELRDRGGTLAFTRHALPDRPAGPPTAAEVAAVADGAGLAFVCGSARFATLATGLLAEHGFPAASTRIEQFGPTG